MNRVVDHNDRSESAGSEAASHLEGKKPVLRGFAYIDSESVPEAVKDILPAAHITGSTRRPLPGFTPCTVEKNEFKTHYSRHFAVACPM